MNTSPAVINKLGDLTKEEFLTQYWQRQPLVIRNQFPDFNDLITPEELAGLALESDVESRLIYQNPQTKQWQVEQGPFSESRFISLPDSHWTLLVQTLDFWLDDACQWLNQFRFIPSWRLDDLMVSFATPQGGVGPHIDQYDVFLVQGLGSRRWQVGRPGESTEQRLVHPLLKQIEPFEPVIDCVLNTGDILYIPPSTPHNGIALENCITYSVGFRAPSHHSLLEQLLLDLTEQDEALSPRYKDYDPVQDFSSHKLPDSLSHWLRQALNSITDEQLITAFGKLVTRPKFDIEPEEPLSVTQVKALLKRPESALVLNPRSRLTYSMANAKLCLFVDGEAFYLPRFWEPVIEKLASGHLISINEISNAGIKVDIMQILASLVVSGHLTVCTK
jgi:50S ribosomal protein L16 3-hydroxylase